MPVLPTVPSYMVSPEFGIRSPFCSAYLMLSKKHEMVFNLEYLLAYHFNDTKRHSVFGTVTSPIKKLKTTHQWGVF